MSEAYVVFLKDCFILLHGILYNSPIMFEVYFSNPSLLVVHMLMSILCYFVYVRDMKRIWYYKLKCRVFQALDSLQQ